MNFSFRLFLHISSSCFDLSVNHYQKVTLSFVSRIPRSALKTNFKELLRIAAAEMPYMSKRLSLHKAHALQSTAKLASKIKHQKGGVPATPSGTATLLRLSPSHQFRPRSLLAVTNFRHPRLPWLDGRCVQGPGTYSPRHG